MNSNKIDYAILALLASLYVAAIFMYQTTPRYIVFATVAFGVAYVLWGLYHQLRSGLFHTRIMLEYLLVALLGVVIVSSLLI